MRLKQQRFQNALKQKQGFKVISGIANHDMENVLTLVNAVNNSCSDLAGSGALALDVAATTDIVKAVRANFDGFLFASGTELESLTQAVEAGADAVELGNFDALYAKGYYISAEEVLTLSQQIVSALGQKAFISITIPGHLTLDAQVKLAKNLEALGVDLMQSEGAARMLSETPQAKTPDAKQKAQIALANTQALANAVTIPVMAASGFDATNVATARAMGASAVGIGSAVNKLTNLSAMETALQEIAANWQHQEALVSSQAG
ncbi:MAG: DUF561 domain-containing protein [Vampirovibrionales bacterium]|nr:DUF561 domain-containing protein [Vampirovibrionales bacterium]